MEPICVIPVPNSTVSELKKIKHKQQQRTLSYNQNLLLLYLSENGYTFLTLPTKTFTQVAAAPANPLINSITYKHSKVVGLMYQHLKESGVSNEDTSIVMLRAGEELVSLFYGKVGRDGCRTKLSTLSPRVLELIGEIVAGWIALLTALE